MKWLPTVLILAAFGVLLWVSSKRPSDDSLPTSGQQESQSRPSTASLAPGGSTTSGSATGMAAPNSPAPAGPSTRPAEPRRPAAPPKERRALSGLVVGPNETGVPDIVVVLLQESGTEVHRQQAGKDGRFVFRDLAAGTYRVTAEDPNLLYTVATTTTVQFTDAGTNDVVVHLDRGLCSVQGVVVNNSGEAVAGSTVELRSDRFHQSVRTNSKGVYQVGGLPQGPWRIGVRGFADSEESLDLRPGQVGEQALSIVELANLRVTLSASPLHPYHFSGDDVVRVRAADGSVEHSKLVPPPTEEEGGHGPSSTTVSFERLQPGDYEVSVTNATGESLLGGKTPPKCKVLEGGDHSWSIPVLASHRGQGIHVPTWLKVSFFIFFGLLFVVPPILFPPPLTPKRPVGLPATPAPAAEAPGESN